MDGRTEQAQNARRKDRGRDDLCTEKSHTECIDRHGLHVNAVVGGANGKACGR